MVLWADVLYKFISILLYASVSFYLKPLLFQGLKLNNVASSFLILSHALVSSSCISGFLISIIYSNPRRRSRGVSKCQNCVLSLHPGPTHVFHIYVSYSEEKGKFQRLGPGPCSQVAISQGLFSCASLPDAKFKTANVAVFSLPLPIMPTLFSMWDTRPLPKTYPAQSNIRW